MTEAWQQDYNNQRPHKALGYLTPQQYYKQWTGSERPLRKSTEALSTSASGGPLRPQAKTIVDKVFGKQTDQITTKHYF